MIAAALIGHVAIAIGLFVWCVHQDLPAICAHLGITHRESVQRLVLFCLLWPASLPAAAWWLLRAERRQ